LFHGDNVLCSTEQTITIVKRGGGLLMKKIIVITLCNLMLFSLLLTVVTVMAAEPGYERFSRPTQVIPTIDGKWTPDNEWTDGEETWIGTDVVFRSTLDGDMTRWIVEFLTDNTNDAADLWRFCIQGFPSQTTGVRMFEINGHSELEWYSLSGENWVVRASDASEIEWANTVSASPTSDTPHWILEFQIDKDSGQVTMDDVWNFYLEVFDKSNPEVLAWPPTDYLVPEEWGVENYNPEPIPEGLTFAVMALLTTISMLVGYKYFIKRKETKNQ
jgi:hypothetical protein